MSRPSVMLVLIVAGTMVGIFLSGGIEDLAGDVSAWNPWLRIGVGLLIGLIAFTVVVRQAAHVTVPAIIVIAIACIAIGLAT